MTPREANTDLRAEITALSEHLASQGRRIAELQAALGQTSQREAATSVIASSPTSIRPQRGQ